MAMSAPDPSSAIMGSTCSQGVSCALEQTCVASSLQRHVLSAIITPDAPRCCALRTWFDFDFDLEPELHFSVDFNFDFVFQFDFHFDFEFELHFDVRRERGREGGKLGLGALALSPGP